MDTAATLVWIAPAPPDDTQARSIASWAQAHSRSLSAPREESPPALRVDPSVADDVERWLDRARDALAAQEGDTVDASLGAAEKALRAHPELPQAPWLLAEVERTRSTRWRRVPPVDPEAAEHAWMRADALDGGRVPGIGEQPAGRQPEAASVRLELSPEGAEAALDGEAIGPAQRQGPGDASATATLSTRAGPHVLVVSWHGVPIWAGWLETPAGTSSVRVTAPSPPPCSAGDLARVRIDPSSGAIAAADARCGQWTAALPGSTPAEIRVAACEANRCGPLLSWRAAVEIPWSPPPERAAASWPAWATWGLVGAGAAIAAGVVIVASGALQSPAPETRFVSGGVRTQ